MSKYIANSDVYAGFCIIMTFLLQFLFKSSAAPVKYRGFITPNPRIIVSLQEFVS